MGWEEEGDEWGGRGGVGRREGRIEGRKGEWVGGMGLQATEEVQLCQCLHHSYNYSIYFK